MATLQTRRTALAVGIAAALVVAPIALGGCVPMPSDPPSVAPSPVTASVPPSASPSDDTPEPSISAGPITEPSPSASGLQVRQIVISGRSGTVSWRIRVPSFSGAPAAAEINNRVRAAVDDQIARATREGRSDGGDKRRLDGEGKVVTNDGRTAQVTVTYGDYLDGTAHPTDYVTTTVVDVAKRRPVTLDQVFLNPTAAYKKLKPAILAAGGEQTSSIDQAGLAPKTANWANWQTTGSGMVFIFGDYQLGTHGLRQYAVGWSTVEPLLTTYAKRVLAPR